MYKCIGTFNRKNTREIWRRKGNLKEKKAIFSFTEDTYKNNVKAFFFFFYKYSSIILFEHQNTKILFQTNDFSSREYNNKKSSRQIIHPLEWIFFHLWAIDRIITKKSLHFIGTIWLSSSQVSLVFLPPFICSTRFKREIFFLSSKF